MADEAVQYNPSANRIPLITGNEQGIFLFFDHFPRFRPVIPTQFQSVTGKFPTKNNREFFKTEQGIFCREQGILDREQGMPQTPDEPGELLPSLPYGPANVKMLRSGKWSPD